MTENYNIVVEQEESTVVAKYERQQENVLVYQSEAQLERVATPTRNRLHPRQV